VREDLLQPSLGSGASPQPLYSPRANFFVAFFGGPFAMIPFSALNAMRLRRLPADLPMYGAAVACAIGAFYALLETSAGAAVAAALGYEETPARAYRFVSRALALVLWGAFHLRHRRFQRSAELLGGARPSPWLPGLACTVLGGAVGVGVVALLAGGLPR
jgi:hypothetical protein